MAEEKTNVMRILDQKRVPYTPHHYAHPNGAVDGASVAALLDRDPASVCKTLVTQGASRQHYVFVIPVLRSLENRSPGGAGSGGPLRPGGWNLRAGIQIIFPPAGTFSPPSRLRSVQTQTAKENPNEETRYACP